MKNNKLLLSGMVCMGAMSYFFYSFNKTSHEETKKALATMKPEFTSPAPMPRFVAGRPSLIKKSEGIYPVNTQNAVLIPPSAATRLPAERKQMLKKSLTPTHVTHIPSMGIFFANDLYACSQSECSNANSIASPYGFNIFKGESPKVLNSKAKFLVNYNKNNNQYGIWERRVIIETREIQNLTEGLHQLQFESVERPQEKMYIAEYNGAVANLDIVLHALKLRPDIKDVRLEITYSRDRGN